MRRTGKTFQQQASESCVIESGVEMRHYMQTMKLRQFAPVQAGTQVMSGVEAVVEQKEVPAAAGEVA